MEATGPLVEARLTHFGKLWELTESGSERDARTWSKAELDETSADMRRWFYTDGAGLLLSDASRRQWTHVVQLMRDESTTGDPESPLAAERNESIRKAMTCLRTRLKQDVHVHTPVIDDTECRDQPGWTASGTGARREARESR